MVLDLPGRPVAAGSAGAAGSLWWGVVTSFVDAVDALEVDLGRLAGPFSGGFW